MAGSTYHGGSSSSGSSGSSGGGGGGGDDPYEKAQKKAEKEAKKQAKATAKRYADQAKVVKLQIDSLLPLLRDDSGKSFRDALNQRLANLNLVYKQQDAALVEGFDKRLGELKGAVKDNEEALSDTTFANLSNRARERGAAISQATLQGAGESDTLKAINMSLRNLDANQSENLRAFYDSQRNLNTSRADLNVDTKSARLNLQTQKYADSDTLWTQFYNQKSQGYTQLGNLYGTEAEYYGQANEAKKSDSYDDKRDDATDKAGVQFKYAAQYAAKTYKNPGNSKALTDWKGAGVFDSNINDSDFHSSTDIRPPKKPEGASLRKWTV